MIMHLQEILKHLNEQGYVITITGSDKREVSGFCAASEIRDNCIMWVKKMEAFDQTLLNGKLNLVVVTDVLPLNQNVAHITYLACKYPKSVYFETLSHFFVHKLPTGISNNACVETSRVGENVSIGHHTYIGPYVVIGDNVKIMNNISIECPTVIGNNCIIGSGTIIGSPGFGYFETAQGIQKKVPDFGGVMIGNNVEIGANVCIDRGTLSDTVIEDHVKIDNLCHIAHNVHIGKNAMVIALSLLGGSCTVEESVYIAPGALIMNQKTIGKGSLVGMGAVVTKDVPERKVVMGVPAKVIRDN